MALTIEDLKAQCNIVGNGENAILTRKLAAATSFIAAQLGFAIDDEVQFPDGTPADLEEAILMTAADWYENREATLIGVSAQMLPMGVREIVDNYRNYSFGLVDEVSP